MVAQPARSREKRNSSPRMSRSLLRIIIRTTGRDRVTGDCPFRTFLVGISDPMNAYAQARGVVAGVDCRDWQEKEPDSGDEWDEDEADLN